VTKTFKFTAAVALAALCSFAGLAQAQEKQEKKVKDQAEYDLFQAATTATDPGKKIAALLAWKEKYPESDYKEDRLVLMVSTYQALNQPDKAYATAQELKTLNPKNPNALYFLTFLPPTMNVTTPARLAEAEQNAQALADAIPDIFKTPPAGVQQAAFDTQKRAFERQVIATKVWAATQQKDLAKVEAIYTAELKKDPNNGEYSYALGQTILGTKNPARQVEALYHIGRAAYYSGPNELPADTKKKVQTFFEKTVTAFTGSKEDVQKIADQTKSSAFPPPDFTIKSQAQKMAEQEEEMKKNDPQKFLWFSVKRELIGENGPAYFEMGVKGSDLPKLKGKLVSAMPANKPKEITIAIMDDTTPEIKLVVDMPFGGAPPPGTVLEFEHAVPSTFTPDPFLVTADIERGQISGWPAELVGPATGAKKTGGVKKAVGKKK